MSKSHNWFVLLALLVVVLANVSNPPDGKTGAPGDGFCTECHSSIGAPGAGFIAVEGFPSSIVPGEVYPLSVVNRDTSGKASIAGFQMTILGPFNTRAGTLRNPSENSVITFSFGRQYFEHHPAVMYPDSHVVRWEVEWVAPDLPAGSPVTWWVAGNIGNGNNMDTGDKIVAANGTGTVLLSGVDDPLNPLLTVYPNPGNEEIRITDGLQETGGLHGEVVFYDLQGKKRGVAALIGGLVHEPDLPGGLYLIQIQTHDAIRLVKWAKS